MRKFNLPQELLKQFYSAIIESVLCMSITGWFSSATKSDLRILRRVVRTAEQIIGKTLPTFQDLYSSRVSKRAGKITLDPSHPAHSLFELLPSGRRYRALNTRTDRTQEQFLPSGNPYHEHLTLIMVHTLFINLYTYLSNTHTKSTFQIAHSMHIHTIVNLYIVIPYLLVLCFFYYLCFCSVSVILLHCGSFMSRKQIPWKCKHTCQ